MGLGVAGPFAPLASLIAPLILLIASGLVIATWWVLKGLEWTLRPVAKIFTVR